VPCRKETKTTGKCQEFSESGAGRLRAEAAVEVEAKVKDFRFFFAFSSDFAIC